MRELVQIRYGIDGPQFARHWGMMARAAAGSLPDALNLLTFAAAPGKLLALPERTRIAMMGCIKAMLIATKRRKQHQKQAQIVQLTKEAYSKLRRSQRALPRYKRPTVVAAEKYHLSEDRVRRIYQKDAEVVIEYQRIQEFYQCVADSVTPPEATRTGVKKTAQALRKRLLQKRGGERLRKSIKESLQRVPELSEMDFSAYGKQPVYGWWHDQQATKTEICAEVEVEINRGFNQTDAYRHVAVRFEITPEAVRKLWERNLRKH